MRLETDFWSGGRKSYTSKLGSKTEQLYINQEWTPVPGMGGDNYVVLTKSGIVNIRWGMIIIPISTWRMWWGWTQSRWSRISGWNGLISRDASPGSGINTWRNTLGARPGGGSMQDVWLNAMKLEGTLHTTSTPQKPKGG